MDTIYRFTCPITGTGVDLTTPDVIPPQWNELSGNPVSPMGQLLVAQRLLWTLHQGLPAPSPSEILAAHPCPLDPPAGTQITTM